MNDHYETETNAVLRQISPGPRLVVIGSTKFWGADSGRICEAIAMDLASMDDLVAVTGGMDGVGLTFGQYFAATRIKSAKPEKLFHLLPRGSGPCESGVTIGAGFDFQDRREVLGRIGQIYLMIEGGPGTEHEAEVAVLKGFPVIPVARTGGHAGAFHRPEPPSPGIPEEHWRTLADAGAPIEIVVESVRSIVRSILYDRN
ncbi:hypothetical protein GC170_20870 [bacterium]|nr:hypothetical protein [bacterium]